MDVNNYLVTSYKEGFVPGPKESFEDFQKRVTLIKKELASPALFLEKLKIPYKTISFITPYYIAIESKKKLPFWFGAMTLICEYEGVKIPILELPKKRSFFVSNEEIIAHEKIHFLRSTFSEKRFEEILAYQTSPSFLRKTVGPIFQTPFESYFCLILFAILSLSPILPFLFFNFVLIVFATCFITAFTRLFTYQWLFRKALKNLSFRIKNGREIITLFTDQEIIDTAFNRPFEKNSPRWQLILQIQKFY
ncbi:MAG: hypothetical protein FJZ59_03435 [Chlamydiae bacterium]|nr:hypothetical protein [Chlamydiota bacterium]